MITYRKYIYQIVGKVLPQFLALLLNSMFIKYIGTDNFSNYSMIILYFSMIYSLLIGGIDIIYQKLHSTSNFINIFIVKIFSFIIIIMPLLLFLNYAYKYSISVILLFSFGFLIQSFIETFLVTFRILEKDEYVLFPKTIQLISLMFFFIVFEPNNLYVFAFLFLISWIVVFTIYGKIILSHVVINFRGFKSFFRNNFTSLVYLGFTIFATQVYINADFVIFEKMYGAGLAGGYKISLILSQSILSVIGAISHIFLSNISKINYRNFSYVDDINYAIKSQLKIVTVISIIFFILSAIFFPLIFDILFSEINKQFVYVSILLILSSIFNGFSMIWSYLLVHLGKEKQIFIITMYTIVLSIVLSYILISLWGIYGAVGANILVQLFLLLTYRYVTLKFIRSFKCVV